ncbi:MAG: NAD(P)/FAD-dependent oxidoreductase [Chloroflexi bacterium]|nr:NAD(P)/FAD-dependent oxidoreductase [Chloroflexota bacterium]
MRVGVVGGGMAGLSAAWRLLRAGAQVHLWEKDRDLGGQVRTFSVEGKRLEGFYHHIFRSDVDIIDLIHELGLGADLGWIPSRVGFFYDGRVYPFGTPLDLLRFSPLAICDRLRLGLFSLRLQRVASGEGFEDLTAQEWLRSHAGERVYRVVWEPLLRGKFGERAPEIGMVWLWSKMRLRFGSRGRAMQREFLGYLNGSFGRVVDVLKESIEGKGGEIHTAAPVDRIRLAGGGVEAVEAGGKSQPCDAAIVTSSLEVLRRLAPELPADFGGGISYLGAMCLVLVLDRPLTSVYWLNIADPQVPFVALVEHTNLVPPEEYGGRRIAYLSNYLPVSSPIYALGKEALLDYYLPALKRIAPGFTPDWVVEYHLFKEAYAQPVITVGYSQRLPPHRTPIRGLYLANTSQIYPQDRGMNYSIRLGRVAADLVLEGLKGEKWPVS